MPAMPARKQGKRQVLLGMREQIGLEKSQGLIHPRRRIGIRL